MVAVNNFEEIKNEIERLREELGKLIDSTDDFNSSKVLEISRDLDILINKYFKLT